jgi:hypothetical protein
VVRPFIPGWVRGENMIEYLRQLNKSRNDEMIYKEMVKNTKHWSVLEKLGMMEEIRLLLDDHYAVRYLCEVVA